ncbi:MAG: metal-dependent hydrolase [Pseudomonadales bacterium]
MDPLSQAMVGAVVAGCVAKPQDIKPALMLGALAGMAPDLDVFIRSAEDPLLFLEYHRQFTHALAFIPIGAAFVALFAWPLFRRHLSATSIYCFCFAGYLTHGLLDACTTYGTQLLWPFSTARTSWDIISIVDPLFTLALIFFAVCAAKRPQGRWAVAGLVWIAFYLGVGEWQRQRVTDAAFALAADRGHAPTRLEAKPGFAQLLLWKSVYEWEGKFFVDGIRVGYSTKTYPGESIDKIGLSWASVHLPSESQTLEDFKRFQWFSGDYLALSPNDEMVVMDVRYSMNVNEIEPLWSIKLDPSDPDAHVRYQTHRSVTNDTWQQFSKMLFGSN